MNVMIGVSPPAEEGDDNAAEEGDDNAAGTALSSEDSYSPNKSVRVAELDLALGLSIGRNHSKVRSFFSSLASSSSSLTRTLYVYDLSQI